MAPGFFSRLPGVRWRWQLASAGELAADVDEALDADDPLAESEQNT